MNTCNSNLVGNQIYGKLYALFLLSLLICWRNLPAQTNTNRTLQIMPVFGDEEVNLNAKYYLINTTDSVQIETLKFYISTIQFIRDSVVVWQEESSFHLVDASINKSLHFELTISDTIQYDAIKFNIGIDSTTNVSGAMGGDLDPTQGMYWTWQSGYINFKLEGKSNLCKTRNTEFQLHIGGYQFPFSTLQTIQLPIQQKGHNIINFDIKKFIEYIDLKTQNIVMSPDAEAVTISNYLSHIIRIQ